MASGGCFLHCNRERVCDSLVDESALARQPLALGGELAPLRLCELSQTLRECSGTPRWTAPRDCRTFRPPRRVPLHDLRRRRREVEDLEAAERREMRGEGRPRRRGVGRRFAPLGQRE